MVDMSRDAGSRGGGGSPSRRFRALVFRVHTWLGLHLCLIFAVIFLTGSALVFAPELNVGGQTEAYIAPPGPDAPRAGFAELYDAASAAVPDGVVVLIQEPPRPWLGNTVTAFEPGRGRLTVWMHPVDARALGVEVVGAVTPHSFLRSLHDSFLVPIKPVQIAVTALSFVLITMVATGLITYRRFWKGFFRMPAPGMDARARNGLLHRTVGLWVMPFLLLIALTSVVYFVSGIGFGGVRPEAPPMAEREWRIPAGFTGADLERIVAIGEAAVPGLEATNVGIPGRKVDPFRVSGYDPALPPLVNFVTVTIDPSTEEVVHVSRATDGNLMAKVIPVASSLHYGEFGGFATQVLWMVFGLASSFLLLTGARVFALRTIRERQGGAETLPKGTLRVLWQGLGVFRWAYVLGFAVMILSFGRTVF